MLTAVCEDDDLVVGGEGAGELYEGGAIDGIGARGGGGDDTEAGDDMDPRISYNVEGGTTYVGCIDR